MNVLSCRNNVPFFSVRESEKKNIYLPMEMIQKCISYLNGNDLKDKNLVSRQWYFACLDMEKNEYYKSLSKFYREVFFYLRCHAENTTQRKSRKTIDVIKNLDLKKKIQQFFFC